MKFLVVFLLVLITLSSINGQSNRLGNKNLSENYTSYFKVDRKNVHLHLNKTVFMTGEHIWFSIYMWNQTQNKPSAKQEYVYVDLIDDKGALIAQKTVLYSDKKGNGDIFLANSLSTGLYFLQAYTASMQDYEEDDSTKYPILINNGDTGDFSIYEYTKKNSTPDIMIAPEGGQMLAGNFGKCVAKILGATGKVMVPDSAMVTNNLGEKISKVNFNVSGVATFHLTPKKGVRYSLDIFSEGKTYSKAIPKHKDYGVALSFVRNPIKKEIAIQLTDNRKNRSQNPITLLVHKDKNNTVFPIDKASKTGKAQFILSYDALFDGVNTISVLDGQGVVKAERLFYQHKEIETRKFNKIESLLLNDSLRLAVVSTDKTGFDTRTFSVSILPGETKAQRFFKNALFALNFENYFPGAEWVDLWSKEIKSMEDITFMDDIMVLAKPKYDWKTILNKNLIIPSQQITTGGISGVVEPVNKKVKPSSILLYSKGNKILLNTQVVNNHFSFENLVFEKGSTLNFSLIGKDGRPHKANFSYHIKPNMNRFRHRFKTNDIHKLEDGLEDLNININSIDNIQELEEVTVTAKRLKYQKYFKSYFGIKVDSSIGMVSLRDMIIKEGFPPTSIPVDYPDTRRAGGIELAKLSRRCGYVFPTIVFDGVFSSYIGPYENVLMDYVDEIYIDRATSCSFTMVVFTNEKYKNRPPPNKLITSKEIVMHKGFEQSQPFKRPEYFANTLAFKHFGILGWHSTDSSNLKIKVPHDSQSSIKVVIEGYTDSGKIISEYHTISLN